jgi:glycosyltransferase involved in cell wall biosynthesis
MSRIAFFTEKLPPDQDPIAVFSYDLMCGLAEQQHELRVFSTYRSEAPLPPGRPRLEILRPFRKWGWLELPRVVPILMEFQPDIIHMIQPRDEALSGLTNAMSAIPGFAPLMGRPPVVTSFYDLREELIERHRLLLLASDVVTVSTRPQQELIAKFFEKTGRAPAITLLPIPGPRTEETKATDDDQRDSQRDDQRLDFQALGSFLECGRRIILVPGNLDEQRDISRLFLNLAEILGEFQDTAVVFAGDWGRTPPTTRHQLMAEFDKTGAGARVYIAGPLSGQQLRICLQHAQLVFAAALAPESLRLAEIVRESLIAAAPLALSQEQARLGSMTWKDREHVLLIQSTDRQKEALKEALGSDHLLASIRKRLPEFARSEALDQPGNVMSRVYAEILMRKRSAV